MWVAGLRGAGAVAGMARSYGTPRSLCERATPATRTVMYERATPATRRLM